MAQHEPTFQRTPISSAPASSPITQLQIALNNLVGQLTEAIYFVAESAPPVTETPSVSDDHEEKRASANREILTKASNIASIISTIETMADKLPDSSRSNEYYEHRIQECLNETVSVTQRLEATVEKADAVNAVLKTEIRRLAEDLACVPVTLS